MSTLQNLPNTEAINHSGDISARQLDEIFSYFPIGDRIKYYPEYQANLTMESLVLGYQINGHTIYSQNHITIKSGSTGKTLIQLHHNNQDIELSRIDSLCLILPGKAGEEYKLNFLSKASLGSRGQFRNGNAITLVARYHERGVIELESSVRESFIPKDGYYRNHRLVLLDVIADSLKVSEQRTHHRLQTNIVAKLLHTSSQTTYSCIVSNYSEVSAQIKLDQSDPAAKAFRNGDKITLTLKIDQLHRTFIIKGIIMRINPQTLIITLQELMIEGEFKPIELIDALDIKACILQHPDSH